MGPPNLSLDSSSKVPMRHSFSSADSDENTACSWRKYSCERSKQLFEVHRKLLRRVCIGIPTFIAKTLAGASLYQLASVFVSVTRIIIRTVLQDQRKRRGYYQVPNQDTWGSTGPFNFLTLSTPSTHSRRFRACSAGTFYLRLVISFGIVI